MIEILASAACSGQSSCPRVTVLASGDLHVVGRVPEPAEVVEAAAPVGFGETALVLPAAVGAAWAREFVAREKRTAAIAAEVDG